MIIYKIIMILLAVFTLIRVYEYFNKKKASLNKNGKQTKINSIKKNNIKDAEFEEIE